MAIELTTEQLLLIGVVILLLAIAALLFIPSITKIAGKSIELNIPTPG
jgi:hypothetical protein